MASLFIKNSLKQPFCCMNYPRCWKHSFDILVPENMMHQKILMMQTLVLLYRIQAIYSCVCRINGTIQLCHISYQLFKFVLNSCSVCVFIGHSIAETLTVALRVAEEAIEEAITKAEGYRDSLVCPFFTFLL